MEESGGGEEEEISNGRAVKKGQKKKKRTRYRRVSDIADYCPKSIGNGRKKRTDDRQAQTARSQGKKGKKSLWGGAINKRMNGIPGVGRRRGGRPVGMYVPLSVDRDFH